MATREQVIRKVMKQERCSRKMAEIYVDETIREYIRTSMFAPKVLPPDLAERFPSYEAWAAWAKQQIDLNQNASKS